MQSAIFFFMFAGFGIVPFLTSGWFIEPLFDAKLLCSLGLGGLVLLNLVWFLPFRPRSLVSGRGLFAVSALGVYFVGHLFFVPFQWTPLLFLLLFVISAGVFLTGFAIDTQKTLKSASWGICLGALFPVSYLVWEIVKTNLYGLGAHHPYHVGFFGTLFGSQNVAAQFCILILPFLWICYLQKKKWRLLLVVYFLFLVEIILISSSRTAFAEMVLVLILGGLCFHVPKKWTLLFVSLLFLQTKLVVPILTPKMSSQGSAFEQYDQLVRQSKSSSIEVRKELWKESFAMMKKAPMGIGLGQYRFNTYFLRFGGLANFKSRKSDRSPHNEFIKVALELGAPLFLGLSVLIFSLYRLWFKSLALGSLDLESHFLVGSLSLILFIESFFHFPMEVVFPVFAFSFLATLLFQLVRPLEKVPVKLPHRFIVSLFVISTLGFAVFTRLNDRALGYFPGIDVPQLCALGLMDWRPCAGYARTLSYLPNPAPALVLMSQLLYRQPFNIHLVGVISDLQVKRFENPQGCLGGEMLSTIFQGERTLWSETPELCGTVLKAIPADELLETYSGWLTGSRLEIHSKYSIFLN